MSERTARRWIWAAVAIGLALRIAFGAFYWVGKPLTHDEREYLALARGLTEGRGFAYDPTILTGTVQQFGRAPGYPAFLAIIGAGREAHDSSPQRVKTAQAFAGAAVVGLIGVIALGAAGPLAGAGGATLAAVYPPLVWIPAYVFSESVYSVMALLSAYVLQLAATGNSRIAAGEEQRGERRSTGLVIAAGGLAGLGILIRPAMLFFVPLAAIWLLRRRQLRLAVTFVMMAAAVVAPWTARNFRAHGRFVLVASEGGVTFWTGNHSAARGEGDLSANPQLEIAELEFRRSHPGLTPEELEPLYYRDALHSIAAEPGRWFVLVLRKLFFTVVPAGPSYTLHSTRYWAASVASYLLVLPMALIGLGRLWRAKRRPTAVLLLGASAVLVCLVFFPQERFRIPVIDPVLIISAAAAIGTSRLSAWPRS